MSEAQSQPTKHAGGCHCGAVRFEVDIDLAQGVSRCNCSWCTKRSGTTAIVKPNAFRLLSGEGSLGDYSWGGKTGNFRFCKHCGVHAFGTGNLEVLGGAYVGVNVNCLDGIDPNALKVVYFDGRHDNWMAGPRDTPWPVNA
ncbi:GFA family protein [Pendulispora brunnea]|uniref:GFA family protein n=1 Tax=Pendulispora brunnea TaxID=2905690 RepID=A0ABZ2K6F1_9BACT